MCRELIYLVSSILVLVSCGSVGALQVIDDFEKGNLSAWDLSVGPEFVAVGPDPTDPGNEEFKEFKRVKQRFLARDKRGQLVFLADSAFTVQMTQQKYPSVKLHFVSEFEPASELN